MVGNKLMTPLISPFERLRQWQIKRVLEKRKGELRARIAKLMNTAVDLGYSLTRGDLSKEECEKTKHKIACLTDEITSLRQDIDKLANGYSVYTRNNIFKDK